MAQMILVVDDSAMVRRYVRQELEKMGFNVAEAADGTAALEALPSVRPVLVISDVNMAPMDGFGLLAGIRAKYTREALPVLMLTTEADDSMKARGKNAGANGWLVKPFDPVRLREVVQHVVAKAGGAGGGAPR
jgi:two-component system chemotaxis response regulator CheY